MGTMNNPLGEQWQETKPRIEQDDDDWRAWIVIIGFAIMTIAGLIAAAVYCG